MNQFFAEHWAASIAALYLFTSAVSALPKPGDPRPFREQVYDFFYSWFHIMSNRAIERHPELGGNTVLPQSQAALDTSHGSIGHIPLRPSQFP